jgi:protein O-mannosyl-transferase
MGKVIPSEKSIAAGIKKPAKQSTLASLFSRYHILLPGLLAIILYANTLGHGFVLDDTLMITGNSFTKEGISAIPDILTNDALTGFFGEEKNLLPGGRYRPLSQVMFAIEWELFGENPFPYHLINVLLYALAVSVLYMLLLRLLPAGASPWFSGLALMTAVFFTAHPMHTEVVANIKGRDEILALWCFLGLSFLALRHAETAKVLPLLWMLPLSFLGLLSKESAITYLVAVPMTLFFFRSLSLKRSFVIAAPILIGIVAYFILRFSLFGPLRMENVEVEILNNPFIGADGVERVATVMATWMKYFSLMLFPFPLTHDYYPHVFRISGFSNPAAISGLIISALLIGYALWKMPRRSVWSWAILFFFTVFSIYSNLLINIGAFMNERFVFLPLLGFSLALALAIKKLSHRLQPNSWKLLMSLFLIVGSLYSLATILRNPAWESNLKLFTTDVKVSGESAKCNVSAGEALINEAIRDGMERQKAGLLNEAVRYLRKGAELHPVYYGAWDKLSLAMVYLEDWDAAIDGYRNCLALRQNDQTALANLAYVGNRCMLKEDYPSLMKAMRLLLDYRPADSLGMYGMGVAWLKTGQPDSAFHYLDATLKLAPFYADAWNKLAEAEGRFRNDLNASARYLSKAYSLDSANANILENLGVLAGFRQQPAEALKWFLKAYELSPESQNLRSNIITSYMIMGDTISAARYR